VLEFSAQLVKAEVRIPDSLALGLGKSLFVDIDFTSSLIEETRRLVTAARST
jgi:hypothetical protein